MATLPIAGAQSFRDNGIMKLQLFTATAVAAIALGAGAAYAAPAGATTVLNGYVGVSFNYADTSENETEAWTNCNGNCGDFYHYHTTVPGFTLDGAAALPVTDRIGLQLDLGYTNRRLTSNETDTYSDSSGYDTYRYSSHFDDTSATGHAFWRTDNWLAGAFVGEENVAGVQLIGGGLEGQYYCGKFTLQGSVGAAKATAAYGFGGGYDGPKPYAVALRLDGRYFVTENLSLAVNGGFMDSEFSRSYTYDNAVYTERWTDSGTLWTVGVTGEYKPKGSPFTAFVEYEHGEAANHYHYTDSGDGNYFDSYREKMSSDSVRIGFRWTFGGSLLQRDRHGASLNSFRKDFGDEFIDDAVTGGYYYDD